MNISVKGISKLVKVVRIQEALCQRLIYSPIGEASYHQMLLNEVYYLKKLNDKDVRKKQLYEAIITNQEIREKQYIKRSQDKLKMMGFDDLFISRICSEITQIDLSALGDIKSNKSEELFFAPSLFQSIHRAYPIVQDKLLYSELITNAYLCRNNKNHYTALISEAIYSNYESYQLMLLSEDNFFLGYISLLEAQTKKNLARIDATEQLYQKNKGILSQYGKAIEEFLYQNVMFSTTQFHHEIDICYNTAKKYLKQLVNEGILKSVKVGKHNAFIYEDLDAIWRS